MRLLPRLIAVAAIAAMVFAPQAEASIIVQYTFGSTASQTLSPTTVSDDVTATAVSNGGGLSQFRYISTLGYASQPVLQVNPSVVGFSTDVATSFTNNNFFQFTITPDPGMELDLTSITFNAGRGGTSTPRRTGLRTDLTGATNLYAIDIGTTRPTWSGVDWDLSGYAALQNITTAVTFKIAVAAAGSGYSEEFDDITVSGTSTLTPEPATLALMGLGIAGIYLGRRLR